MRLKSVHVTNYRSIIDSGLVDLEDSKTILVGPNEAGKTALLQAIQHIKAPDGIKPLSPLRDYPRSKYNEITQKIVDPSESEVVKASFELDQDDLEEIDASLGKVSYEVTRYLDNSRSHRLIGAPDKSYFKDVKDDLLRLAGHMDRSVDDGEKPSDLLKAITDEMSAYTLMQGGSAKKIMDWLDGNLIHIDEDDEKEAKRLTTIREKVSIGDLRNAAEGALWKRVPKFVLFNNYFRVKPIIHLGQLASRIANGSLDDERYDYGNVCLLKLLGFEASELSEMGKASDPNANDPDAIEEYREKLDERQYQLNAAEVRLTKEIKEVWNPDEAKGEAAKLRLRADGQYLKVVVEDDLGVEVELDQRSEGFQWLVSFFVVFFAEAEGEHDNAILLLDEPGMSLHALKQREFRKTISKLAENNQTVYTTHSPFLVGPDELDQVRVVEMASREEGTKVHTSITANDPAALLPLQEALGYDLAQSLFTQKMNLILEGLTDYWYLEAAAGLLRESGGAKLNEKIALVPSNTAGKVAYFATILHAQDFRVAALLDSDNAGDNAAKQEVLVHTLGNQAILRTKDFLKDGPKSAEIEDLLRHTLPGIANNEFGKDVRKVVNEQADRPIIDIFNSELPKFSKYRLAKAFVRWCRDHEAGDLHDSERESFEELIKRINSVLKA